MTRSAIVILTLLLTVAAYAEPEPLIPEKINRLLGEVKPRMTIEALRATVKKYYPKGSVAIGDWSGNSGGIDCKLDDRYRFSVTGYSDAHGRH